MIERFVGWLMIKAIQIWSNYYMDQFENLEIPCKYGDGKVYVNISYYSPEHVYSFWMTQIVKRIRTDPSLKEEVDKDLRNNYNSSKILHTIATTLEQK